MHLRLIFCIFSFFLIPTQCIKYSNIVFGALHRHFRNIINTIPASNSCLSQLKTVVHGIKSEKIWALEMLDATAKPKAGILSGDINQIGNYDQCLAIRKELDRSVIEGKHCTAIASRGVRSTAMSISELLNYRNLKVNQFTERLIKMVITWDFCFPAACSVDDLQLMVDAFIRHLNLNFTFRFFEGYCHYKSKPLNFTSTDYFAVVFLIVLFCIISLSTFFDMKDNLKGDFKDYLLAFSLYSNLKSLFSTKPGDTHTLSCISGLRVLSMFWIIISHQFLLVMYMPVFHSMSKLHNVANFPILGSTLAVDTFFTISGLLVTYNFLQAQERGFKITLTYFYLHRILRLLPALAVLILLYASLLRFTRDGPLWNVTWIVSNYETCYKNWWWNLLFIQNYSKTDRCAHFGWYLSIDMQLYALSPLFLFPLSKHPKRVMTILSGVILACTAAALVISLKNNLGVNFIHDRGEIIYLSTYLRAPAFLIGSICGYLLFKNIFLVVKLNSFSVRIIWIVCFTMMIFLPYSYFSVSYDEVTDVYSAALVNSLSRPLWSLCVCWIVYACVNGHGGAINKFLSLPFFVVCARVTYCMYLTHLTVLQLTTFSTRGPLNFSNLFLYREAIGNCFFVIPISVLWSVCFERPILVLEKVIFKKGSKVKSGASEYDEDKNASRVVDYCKRNLVD